MLSNTACLCLFFLAVGVRGLANCPPPSEPHLPVPTLSATELSVLQHNLTAELNNRSTAAAASDPSYANCSISLAVTGMGDTPFVTYSYGPEGTGITTDSIFRIGSVGKVFAVYEALVNGLDLGDPVAKWVPEFRKDRFDEITVRGLAGYISGLTRDYPVNDISVVGSEFEIVHLIREAVPIPESDKPSCSLPRAALESGGRACSAEAINYISILSTRPRIYPSNSFPAYSNMAYDLLGHIVTVKTGTSSSDLVTRDIAVSLNMSRTSLLKPSDDSLGIIPTETANSTWYEDFRWTSWSGSMYSTASDLARFARAILKGMDPNAGDSGDAIRLPPQVLREWLHPMTYTSSSAAFLGLPSEDFRPSVTGLNGGFPFTVHNKAGGITGYSGELAIVPEYGFGLAVLASEGPETIAGDTRSFLVERVARFLEAARVKNAREVYAGRYSSGSINRTSVIELEVPDNELGLRVREWKLPGLDIAAAITAIKLRGTPPDLQPNTTSIRFYPAPAGMGDTWRYFFNASLPVSSDPIAGGLCEEYTDADQYYYGNQPLDMIRFIRDEADQNVVGVEIPWLRLELTKESP